MSSKLKSATITLLPNPGTLNPLNPIDGNGEYIMGSRVTDQLNPLIINDANTTVDAQGNNILTVNKSLFVDRVYDEYVDPYLDPLSISSFNNIPTGLFDIKDILNTDYEPATTLIVHEARKYSTLSYNDPNTALNPNHFEHAAWSPNTLRIISNYETFPLKKGVVWSWIPDKTIWEGLIGESLEENSKGRLVATAYRDEAKHPFEFVVYKYDARGRVKFKMKFTENIGFDYVEYKYNSFNQVIALRTVDALSQHCTWYSYDDEGRMNKVWTNFYQTGHGGINGSYPQYISFPSKPNDNSHSIALNYDDNTNLLEDKIYYYDQNQTLNITQSFVYDKAQRVKVIDSDQYNSSGTKLKDVFYQNINYRDDGLIENISSSHIDNLNPNEMYFSYDNIGQLTEWSETITNTSGTYHYDLIGNRTQSRESNNFNEWFDYSYYNLGNQIMDNNQLEVVTNNNQTNRQEYSYLKNGAMNYRSITRKVDQTHFFRNNEYYTYNDRGLVTRYTSMSQLAFDNCFLPPTSVDSTNWRYRFNESGEREKKRMYRKAKADGIIDYPWVYYQLDKANKQLRVYHGIETTKDNIDLLDKNAMMVPSIANTWTYEPNPVYNPGVNKKAAVFMYPVEMNVLGNSGNVEISYRNYSLMNTDFKKEFLIYDHLGSIRAIIDEDGFIRSERDYGPFGDVIWSNEYEKQQRSSWIGKEKDPENNLGDFGVRKYDDFIGRFNSIDPLWEKYYAWNPYFYSANNPIVYKDINGNDFMDIVTGDFENYLSQSLYDSGMNDIKNSFTLEGSLAAKTVGAGFKTPGDMIKIGAEATFAEISRNTDGEESITVINGKLEVKVGNFQLSVGLKIFEDVTDENGKVSRNYIEAEKLTFNTKAVSIKDGNIEFEFKKGSGGGKIIIDTESLIIGIGKVVLASEIDDKIDEITSESKNEEQPVGY